MKTREQILSDQLQKYLLRPIDVYNGTKVIKHCIDASMDEYSKQISIGFSDWIVDKNWFKMVGTTGTWVNQYDTLGYRKKTTEDLYDLYIKSLKLK